MLPNLPDIKINLDPKYVAYLVGGVFFSLVLMALGYSLGTQPEEVVCRNYIEELKAANSQIIDLEKNLSSRVSEASMECVSREKEICSELVSTTVDRIKRLRCKICESGGVR